MSRVIFLCPYLKAGETAHRANLVKYLATREGVDLMDDKRRQLPATEKQQKLIMEILHDFPQAKELFEYEDYLESPDRGNASDFITLALEQNLDQIAKRENYVDYISTRPRVQKQGSHGLFSSGDDPLILSHVADEVAHHAGNVWTPIISLRREDAARLGYDNARNWQAFLSAYAPRIAEGLKIHPDHFRWYAAFHDEGHHPHVHMICYSTDLKEGYLTKKGIAKIKSGLANELFRLELTEIYTRQSQRRDELTAQAKEVMARLIARMESGVLHNERIETLTAHLAERLRFQSGKKQYGYLPAKLKSVVDEIVDELAKDNRVAEAYRLWYEMRNEVLRTYLKDLPDALPLSKQKEFKSVRNMVISEAMNIGRQNFTFEESLHMDEPLPDEPEAPAPAFSDEPLVEEEPGDHATPQVEWSKRYKLARQYLYGSDDMAQDFEEAYKLFLEEAQNGNALAMHDLGRMFADGLGRDVDSDKAREWYAKALAAFLAAEEENPGRYLEYRIGKMYAAGLGTEQDYAKAAGWFEKSAEQNYRYAQYSLGSLYYQGKGVKQDYGEAFVLYSKSAAQGFPYACFELGKMLRDGIGAEKDTARSEQYFRMAFSGFRSLEVQSRDDRLQYRLGWMLLNGVGTDKNLSAAKQYFEKSALLGNTYAGYQLAKLILADEAASPDKVSEAVKWLTQATDSGNAFAQYALAKLYRDGVRVEKDIPEAVRLFTLAAGQGNEYAAYQLGKLYLSGGDIPKDVPAALRWLTILADQGNQYAQYTLGKLYLSEDSIPKDVPAALRWLAISAEKGNQYAQYALGKLYLLGRDIPQDREAAIRWFTASAAQGNIYAQFFLDHLDSFRDPSVFLAATRMLHHMGRVFADNMPASKRGSGIQLDRKLLRRLQAKKIAQGHKPDDREQEQTPGMTMTM
jgi:TPR repeat protein